MSDNKKLKVKIKFVTLSPKLSLGEKFILLKKLKDWKAYKQICEALKNKDSTEDEKLSTIRDEIKLKMFVDVYKWGEKYKKKGHFADYVAFNNDRDITIEVMGTDKQLIKMHNDFKKALSKFDLRRIGLKAIGVKVEWDIVR